MKKMMAGIGMIGAGLCLLAGCGSDNASSTPATTTQRPTTKPAANSKDWTNVFSKDDGIEKRCDGTTLVYTLETLVPLMNSLHFSYSGLSAIPDSPECGYKPPAPATVTVTATPSATATAHPTP